MTILILTQYFPPEVGAPQNRLYELAVRLNNMGCRVTVLTAMPNYPQMKIYPGYAAKWYCHETMNALEVHRSWIYVSQRRSIASRLLNYFSFVCSSFFVGIIKVKKTDIIFCESPPLFLGITAWLLKKIKGSKLVFNVSDLWPESAEKLGIIRNKIFLGAATRLEEWMYAHAELITGQTQGIVSNIVRRFPGKKVHWFPNGVDLNYFNAAAAHTSWRKKHALHENDFVLLYAGILGHAQGLEVILNAAARLISYPDIKFLLVGSGPEKEALQKLKKEKSLHAVVFIETVAKKEIPDVIASADAAIVPLKKIDLFKGAIPSKIFENLAMKKPVLLGVEGEARTLFIDEGKCGLAFEPENDADLAEKILILYNDRTLLRTLGENGRYYVEKKFNRDTIAEELKKHLDTLA